jgi:hypothetical protein
MEQSPTFSVVLPFGPNDAHKENVVRDFRASFDKLGEPYEIIIVINGKSDAPSESSERIVSEDPRIIEGTLREVGWGLAILWGFERSRGTYFCYTNTARTDAEEFAQLLRYALIFKNWIVKSSRIERTNMRKWVSIFFNIENRVVLGTPVWDANSTPKIIPRDIFQRLGLHTKSELFDAEILYKASKNRIPIVEIPILQWERKSGKSVTNWYTALKLFVGVLWLRWGDK